MGILNVTPDSFRYHIIPHIAARASIRHAHSGWLLCWRILVVLSICRCSMCACGAEACS